MHNWMVLFLSGVIQEILSVVIIIIFQKSMVNLFWENGVFTSHLDYEYTSTNGTTILRWNGFKAESQFVHGSKVKLKPNDWILILKDGGNGVILIPMVV